jgi:hypothetical protein
MENLSERLLKWLDVILNNPTINEACTFALIAFVIWFIIAWAFLPLILYRKLNRISDLLSEIAARLPPK